MARVHLAKGFRDHLPEKLVYRNRVMEIIRHTFQNFGFDPLETPTLERLETLTGKYGDEGNQLIFKVLKRGEGGKRGEVDLALRYDLTVPLARVVAMNPSLPMPWKRYQMQPVWRADRPQRGRFREFHQCDVDIVGSQSTMAEAECLTVVNAALSSLGFSRFTIRLNDRRILRAMAEAVGAGNEEASMVTAIDKLDKIGEDGVRADLLRRNFSPEQVDQIFVMLNGGAVPGIADCEQDLEQIKTRACSLGVPSSRIKVDRTLARGLDYYTGPVFETCLDDDDIGSISGGGRYDGLIGRFSGRSVPAVGVSIGIERIIVLMEERGMLADASHTTQVWVTMLSNETEQTSLHAVYELRKAGISAEISLGASKLKKQFKQAHRRGVSWVVTIGPQEQAAGLVQLKDMNSGEQELLSLTEAIARIKH